MIGIFLGESKTASKISQTVLFTFSHNEGENQIPKREQCPLSIQPKTRKSF